MKDTIPSGILLNVGSNGKVKAGCEGKIFQKRGNTTLIK
jgi:hypothetical protein